MERKLTDLCYIYIYVKYLSDGTFSLRLFVTRLSDSNDLNFFPNHKAGKIHSKEPLQVVVGNVALSVFFLSPERVGQIERVIHSVQSY